MGNLGQRLRDRKALISSLGISIAIALTNIFANPTPAHGATQIRFWYAPFGEFTIYTSDLEQFVKDGQINTRLELYLGRLTTQQQTQVRDILSTRYSANHVAIANFTYSLVGEILVKRFGTIVKMAANQNGFSALRSALILSTSSDQGLSVLNVLQKYPVPVIYLDLPRAMQAYAEISLLTYKKDLAIAAIEKQAIAETQNENKSLTNTENDLRIAGNVKWTKEKFTYLQRDRQIEISADLYIPQGLSSPAPLIVISHGLGSNPDTLQYLSQHLASHGFAIAVPEHPKTGSREVATFLSDLSKSPQSEEAVQRPLDVKYLLDALEQKTKTEPRWRTLLNPEQVGLIGHSLGGYTVLTLAGAQINPNQECRKPETEVISFNVSQVLQCHFSYVTPLNLSDRRVKAVLAINPLGGSLLFGREGVQNIKIPLAIFSGGNDLLTPAIPEQILPFVWSKSVHKYLVAFPKGTHFSFLERSDRGVVLIPETLFGEQPKFTHPYAKALSLAFFQTYLNNRPQFANYLNNNYVQTIASPQFPASITSNFTETQLLQALGD
jgi:predicted dienelactone hydrolase